MTSLDSCAIACPSSEPVRDTLRFYRQIGTTHLNQINGGVTAEQLAAVKDEEGKTALHSAASISLNQINVFTLAGWRRVRGLAAGQFTP